jgi:hypothetical protein
MRGTYLGVGPRRRETRKLLPVAYARYSNTNNSNFKKRCTQAEQNSVWLERQTNKMDGL